MTTTLIAGALQSDRHAGAVTWSSRPLVLIPLVHDMRLASRPDERSMGQKSSFWLMFHPSHDSSHEKMRKCDEAQRQRR